MNLDLSYLRPSLPWFHIQVEKLLRERRIEEQCRVDISCNPITLPHYNHLTSLSRLIPRIQSSHTTLRSCFRRILSKGFFVPALDLAFYAAVVYRRVDDMIIGADHRIVIELGADSPRPCGVFDVATGGELKNCRETHRRECRSAG